MKSGFAKWAFVAAASLSAAEALANEREDGDRAASLDEVIVEGRKSRSEDEGTSGTKTGTPLLETPMSISVISEQRIEVMNLANVADVLRYVAGAQDNTNVWEHSDGYNVRGFDQSAYILLDGQLRNDPGWWATSDTFALERIEVIKGPASVLYGQSPPGGMVAMTTKRPRQGTRNTVEVTAGRFDERAINFDLSHALSKDGDVQGRMVAVYSEEGDQIRTVDFDRRLIQPSVSWNISEDTQFTVTAWYQLDRDDYNSDVPAYGTLYPGAEGKLDFDVYLGDPQFKDRYDTTQNALSYEFRHRFNDAWSFTQNFRHLRVDVTGTDVIYSNGLQEDLRTMNRAISDYTETVRNWQVDNRLLGKFSTGRIEHTFLAGLDYGHFDWGYDGDYGEISSIDIYEPQYGNVEIGERSPWTYQSKPRQLGAYVQEQAKFAGHLVALLGGRFDRARNSDNDGATKTRTDDGKFSGRVGLLYLFDGGFAPYVSYATSFLPLAGTDVNGRSFVPETGEQTEVGLKYEARDGRYLATLAAFDIVRANMLTRDPIYPAFQVQNGEQHHRGVELEATLKPLTGLRIDAAYSVLDARVTQSFDPGIEGKRPNDVSRNSGSLFIDYALGGTALRGFGFNVGVNYRGSAFGDPENTIEQPAYTLLDAGIRYAGENWRVALSGTNLKNEQFVSSCWTADYCARNEPRLWSITSAYHW